MRRALAVVGIGALLMTGAPAEAPAIPTDTEILVCGEITQGLPPDIPVGLPVSLLFFLNTLANQSPAASGSYSGANQRLGSVRIAGQAISADMDTIDQTALTYDGLGILDPIAVGSPPVFLGGTVVIAMTGTGNDILTIGPEFDVSSLAGSASVNVEIPNDPDPPIIIPIVLSIDAQGDECPVPIPATPPWGLWLLAGLLLAALGVFMLRRRDDQPAV